MAHRRRHGPRSWCGCCGCVFPCLQDSTWPQWWKGGTVTVTGYRDHYFCIQYTSPGQPATERTCDSGAIMTRTRRTDVYGLEQWNGAYTSIMTIGPDQFGIDPNCKSTTPHTPPVEFTEDWSVDTVCPPTNMVHCRSFSDNHGAPAWIANVNGELVGPIIDSSGVRPGVVLPPEGKVDVYIPRFSPNRLNAGDYRPIAYVVLQFDQCTEETLQIADADVTECEANPCSNPNHEIMAENMLSVTWSPIYVE